MISEGKKKKMLMLFLGVTAATALTVQGAKLPQGNQNQRTAVPRPPMNTAQRGRAVPMKTLNQVKARDTETQPPAGNRG